MTETWAKWLPYEEMYHGAPFVTKSFQIIDVVIIFLEKTTKNKDK